MLSVRHRRRALRLGSIAIVAAVLAASVASAIVSGGGRFDPTGTVSKNGFSVRVSGVAPACARSDRIFLSVSLGQSAATADGTWRTHTCTGKRRPWSLTARVMSGRFREGKAIAHALARIKHNGKTITTNRWSARLKLKLAAR